MSNSQQLVLLDTHIWIWLMNGSPNMLKEDAIKLIESLVPVSGIRVSAISVWEVGMLESKERIRFPISCSDWIAQALNAPGLSLAPFSPDIAIESSRLPGEFHGDPADRIIVATARKLNTLLITHDKQMMTYGEDNNVRVFEGA